MTPSVQSGLVRAQNVGGRLKRKGFVTEGDLSKCKTHANTFHVFFPSASDVYARLNNAIMIFSGTSCGIWTKGGNGNGGCCMFPFSYHGVLYYTCTYQDHHDAWCAVTSDFDKDGVWGECIGNLQTDTFEMLI